MLNLANWIRSRSPVGRKAAKLYGSIVTQSREPTFYRDLGIPDTPSGRYEVLVLHMAIALHRLNAVEKSDGPVSRALTEAFVADIDDSLREMAFGDMSVPRRVKKAAAGLMERCLAYRGAFEVDDRGAVVALIAEFLTELPADKTKLVADYACRAAKTHPPNGRKDQNLESIGLFPVILQHAE
ncbi:MAG: ubiquinol-cytochrome C chaperone family protein [Pseudomonadota bacterium]